MYITHGGLVMTYNITVHVNNGRVSVWDEAITFTDDDS